MKDSLQTRLNELIQQKDLDCKINLAFALQEFVAEPIMPLVAEAANALRQPGRPENFQTIHPRKVPKRNINDPKHRAHFLHALANIELFAIELPALCLLRFGSQDLDFISTQLRIIAEEAKHFQLLKNRLDELGLSFGSIATHMGLWDYAWRCESELEHQIAIPCYLEARGLDVCPEFVVDLKAAGDEPSSYILQIILDDEVGHVQAGMEYLKLKAMEMHSSPDAVFERVLRRVFDSNLKSKIKINSEFRRRAGFTQSQIHLLETGQLTHE